MSLLARFKHLLFPHESNNFRPRTLHLSALLFYIVIFLLLQTTARVVKLARPDILGFATDINVEKLINLTNLQRAQAGLPPLSLNSQLSAAANAKANDMFSKNYWAHNSPDGSTPWVFVNQAGYHYLFAGENLARDFGNSNGVVSAWMVSPSHRDNLLKKEYQEVGFAVVNGRLSGEETTLVVQFFGTPQPTIVNTKQVLIPSVAATTVRPTATPVVLPSATPSSLPVVAQLKKELPPTPPTIISNLKAVGVSSHPLINFFSTSKNFASVLTLVLLTVLALDGAVIWHKKIIRVSGHNLAHIIFLVGLLSALWITSQGTIL